MTYFRRDEIDRLNEENSVLKIENESLTDLVERLRDRICTLESDICDLIERGDA